MCITSLPQNPNSLYQGVDGKDLENEGGKDSSPPFFGCSRWKKKKKKEKKSEKQRGKDPLPHRSTFTIYPQTNSGKGGYNGRILGLIFLSSIS